MLAPSRQPIFELGECEVDLARRELRVNGVAVPVGARAFEIVETLIRSYGELVTKNDLMLQVWPGTFVEENTLQAHIAAVRKALGPYRTMLKTESGRGYRLVGGWAVRDGLAAPPEMKPSPVPAAASGSSFPTVVGGLIGRTAAARRLGDLLSAYRVVTLVGPGGIGKTALGIEVARGMLTRFEDGGWFVELASLTDPDLVPSAVAEVFGFSLVSGTISAEAVARGIAGRNVLLFLDNCEHVIKAAAELVETIVRFCLRATVLVTSREVLRVAGESVFYVPPLEVPGPGRTEPGDVLDHSAVQLFVARVRALDSNFSPRGANLLTIASICRCLDGIPLAIEFAAARTATLGVERVAKGLEDRFALLTSGRRTALPRHQTLRATLDWSYELLPETERLVLRHLAAFAGEFTLEGAASVTSGNDAITDDIIETIANLVAKSLVIFAGSGSFGRWRLLETIRAYSLEKLKANNELEVASRRHAKYHGELFGQARGNWESQPTAAWLAEYGFRLDDLRAALDWAFSPGGDAALGMALTIDAVPLWMQHSLMGECRRRVEQALSYIDAETNENARLRMRLWTAFSLSGMYAGGPQSDIEAAWSTALDLAVHVGDPDYQLRAIWGLFAGSFNRGDSRAALRFAERFRAVATDPAEQLIGERLIGTALHMLGEQNAARRHIEDMLAGYTSPVSSSHIIRYQNDQVTSARRVLALILWLQGYPDQAMKMVEDAVTDALALGHVLTLCNFLAQSACRLAFMTGDLAAAKRYTAILIDQATRYSLDVWNAYGRCFEGLLLVREGDFEVGMTRIRDAGHHMRQVGFMQYYTPWLSLSAEALAASGQFAPALAAIDEAIARSEKTEERWCLAELLRIKGELLSRNIDEVATAENCFRDALTLAREQDALSLELRVATSLCRMMMARGSGDAAKEFLAPVYNRFTEGFATADLRAARALLDSLS